MALQEGVVPVLAEPAPAPKAIIRHLHAFRAIAIIGIVAAHSWSSTIHAAGGPAERPELMPLHAITQTLFHGTTLFFAFISGLLFSLVLSSKSWSSFYRGRFFNVVCPYLVVTAFFTLCTWKFAGPRVFDGSLLDYFIAVGRNAYKGRAMFHLWYIPVFIVLLLLTPILAWMVRQERLRPLIWLLICLPLLVSREPTIFSARAVIYFLGAYLVGMLIAVDYEKSIQTLRAHAFWLWIAFLTSAGVLLVANGGAFDQITATHVIESMTYTNKMAAIGLILPWLKAAEQRLPRWLDPLASYSFTIYLLHAMFAIMLSGGLLWMLSGPLNLGTASLAGFAVLAISLVVPFLLGMLLKRVLGPMSRPLIGV
jgi:surface polysaccharide O-acyltransferase-like enzyme